MKKKAVAGDDLGELIEAKRSEIRRLSRRARIPGMDREDVEAEMFTALWKAWDTYDPGSGLTIGQYWWAVWLHRQSDLTEKFFAQKRIQNCVPMEPQQVDFMLEEMGIAVATADELPPCPTHGELDQKVWKLLAMGYQGKEVRSMLGIGWRKFYNIVEMWKSDPLIRSALV